MGKLTFTLSNILFWISLIASCLLLENVAFLTNNSKGGLNDTYFFMFFALAIVGYIAYFIIEHVKNHASIDFFLLGVLVILFGCSLIAVWNLKSVEIDGRNLTTPIIYSQDVWQQTKHSLSLLVFVMTLYSILFYFNKNYPSVRKVQVLFVLIMVITYASIIYSLVFESSSYAYFFSHVTSRGLFVKSFFWHSNMFSGMILMGLASAIGLNVFKKNVFSYISIFAFFFMSVLVGAMTVILIAMLAIAGYFLFEIIMRIRKQTKVGIVLLGTYIGLIVTLFVLYAAGIQGYLGSFSYFCKSLHTNIKNSNFNTYTGRTTIWNSSLEFISDKPLNIAFGFGFRNSNPIIGDIFTSTVKSVSQLSVHSGYLQIFMNFGLVGVIAYLGFLVYYIYCFIRLLKNHLRYAILFFFIGLMFIAYSFTESVIFFNPNTQGILVGVAFFLPMVNRWKHIKHRQLGDDVLKVEHPQVLAPTLLCKSIAKIIMSLIAVTAAMFVFSAATENEHIKYLLVNIIVLLFICLCTLPSIISSMSIKRSRKAFIANTAVNLLLVFGAFALLTYFNLNKSLEVSTSAKWVYPIILTIVLIGEVIIFSVGKRRTFTDYLHTYTGASKNSAMGVLGVALIALITLFVMDKIDTRSALTYVIYALFCMVFFYLFSYFIPFKDSKEIVNHYNNLALYSLKKDVLKDRLVTHNEKRKD